MTEQNVSPSQIIRHIFIIHCPILRLETEEKKKQKQQQQQQQQQQHVPYPYIKHLSAYSTTQMLYWIESDPMPYIQTDNPSIDIKKGPQT